METETIEQRRSKQPIQVMRSAGTRTTGEADTTQVPTKSKKFANIVEEGTKDNANLSLPNVMYVIAKDILPEFATETQEDR